MIWNLQSSEYPRKVDVGARQAGINKHKKPSSETKGNNQGKPPRFVVACYECNYVAGYPISIVVNSKSRKAVCKAGHVIDCSGGCKPNEPSR